MCGVRCYGPVSTVNYGPGSRTGQSELFSLRKSAAMSDHCERVITMLCRLPAVKRTSSVRSNLVAFVHLSICYTETAAHLGSRAAYLVEVLSGSYKGSVTVTACLKCLHVTASKLSHHESFAQAAEPVGANL